MQLFFNPDLSDKTTNFTFDKEESRHIIRVLRKKVGDDLQITNGKGFLFFARIANANDKKCSVNIERVEKKQKPWNYFLHIAIAPTKLNDRFEWFLEKSTEIGIDEITPIICDNSERKVIKFDRFQKVIVSAMKQSLKFQLPKLNPPEKFGEITKKDFHEIKLIAHCEDSGKNSLKKLIQPKQSVLILIGPEGDFSLKEISKALQHNYIPLSLGESRLRTETAGIVACNTVSIINE